MFIHWKSFVFISLSQPMALPSVGGITVQAKWVCQPLPMAKSHSLALWSHLLVPAQNRSPVGPTIQPLLPVSKDSPHVLNPKSIIYIYIWLI